MKNVLCAAVSDDLIVMGGTVGIINVKLQIRDGYNLLSTINLKKFHHFDYFNPILDIVFLTDDIVMVSRAERWSGLRLWYEWTLCDIQTSL